MVAIAQALKPAPAVFIGMQSGCGLRPDFALYNLTADIPGHPEGSTVSAQTLERNGFFLPASLGNITAQPIGEMPVVAALPAAADCPQSMVFLEVVNHPAGGWTHAEPIDATVSTKRIYRGWWPTRRAANRALELKFSSP